MALASILSLAAVGSATAKATNGTALPPACKLVTRPEAQRLLGLKLQPANNLGGRGCVYTSYPTGSPGQVEVYVDSTIPRTLQIDREVLHHKFWKVPRLGDQALEEEWTIFVRKGTVWITIHVTRLEPWPLYRKRLEQSARVATSRVKPARRAAGARTTSGTSNDTPALVGRERWTGKERRFGGDVTGGHGIVFQPAVVEIGGGANAIRSVSNDGLTWTIDAKAPGASDLRPGKIMLATTFATGRVLKLTRVGPSVRVVLGPVKLTDIIRDGEFSSRGAVPLANPILVRAPLPAKPAKKKRRPQARAAAGGATCSETPFWGAGPGVRLFCQNGSGEVRATLQLYAARPSVEFHIRIGGSQLVQAGFRLHGLGGLRYDVAAATMNGQGNFESDPIEVPQAITIPLSHGLALTITQSFRVALGLVGRATMKTAGDYSISGTVGFGYTGGSLNREALTMGTRIPVSQSTLSLGVGQNMVTVGYDVRATVGVGAVVLTAGAWGELNAGLALLADGSHLQSLKFGCTTVGLDVRSKFGVGYSVADFVRQPINALLGLFKVKPIPKTGGPSWGPFPVWQPPATEWCPNRK